MNYIQRGKEMKVPFKEVVLDGGAVIALLLSGEESELFKNILNENIVSMTTSLAIIETEYILCRKIGKEKAFEKVDNLIDSNYVNITPLEHFRRDISILKCNNTISVPDCATIALATINKIPALFAKKEEELKKPIENNAFKIKIFFLEDLTN
ncbi:MAG: PIN domain-containing protein [Promethearchaeota archaeon]|nr:MAG: PIN domain-containing protein [Candidatus Lokiarchaeota archaeon]